MKRGPGVANLLTALRGVAAFPFAFAMAHEGASAACWAGAWLVVAVVTDLADGPLARRTGRVSPTTRLFDHGSDFLFVVAGLGGAALRGVIPALLPIVVSIAFLQYVIDSAVLARPGTLRGNRLGQVNGVLYFAPLIGDVAVRLGVDLLAPALRAVSWALVVTTAVSMWARAHRLLRSRRTAPDSRSAGTPHRWPR